MIFRKNIKIALIFCITLVSPIFPKNIIWDLGGVLLKPDKFKIACEIGLSNLALHAIQDFKIPDIEPKVFDFLSLLNEDDYPNKLISDKGKRIPDIMVDWMLGIIEGPRIIPILLKQIEDLYTLNYFSSYSEKKIVKKAVQAIFDPVILSKNIKVVNKGLDLVKKCAKKHELFILSNWDSLSYDRIYDRNPKLFKHFNPQNIFVSGHCNLLKPNANFYEFLLNQKRLDPRDCVFIDDQEENIIAAQKLGITGIWLKDSNYKKLKEDLIAYGILD